MQEICFFEQIQEFSDDRKITQITSNGHQMCQGHSFWKFKIFYQDDGKQKSIQIKRRYSQFEVLQKSLRSRLPGVLIPSLPQKNIHFTKQFLHLLTISQQLIQKRKIQLQNFIERSMQEKTIRQHQEFNRFFLSQDYDLLQIISPDKILREIVHYQMNRIQNQRNIVQQLLLNFQIVHKRLQQFGKLFKDKEKDNEREKEKFLLFQVKKQEKLQNFIKQLIYKHKVLLNDYNEFISQYQKCQMIETFISNLRKTEDSEKQYFQSKLREFSKELFNLAKQYPIIKFE